MSGCLDRLSVMSVPQTLCRETSPLTFLFRRVMIVLINKYTAEFELISKRELKYFNDFDSAYEVLGEP
jgi:hypothetical protein